MLSISPEHAKWKDAQENLLERARLRPREYVSRTNSVPLIRLSQYTSERCVGLFPINQASNLFSSRYQLGFLNSTLVLSAWRWSQR